MVDLERSRAISRIVFWPSLPTTDVFPLRVSGSEDGRRWEPLGTVPALARQPTFAASGRPVFRPRNGWLELVVAPRPLRYLRVEPAEWVGNAPWGVAELQVYEAADEAPPSAVSVDALVERLRAQGIDRLLANPVASARVARATRGAVSTLAANGVVDNHGAAPPEWLAQPIRLRARDGMLVPIEDVPELRERLDAAGARYVAEPLGDHALLRVLAPFASSAPCRPPAHRAVHPGARRACERAARHGGGRASRRDARLRRAAVARAGTELEPSGRRGDRLAGRSSLAAHRRGTRGPEVGLGRADTVRHLGRSAWRWRSSRCRPATCAW